MKSFPLVSIVMPAFNEEKHIAQSIESVLTQTHTNWELLVVNDGSTDNTEKIIKAYCNNDIRIQYFYQQNGRQGKARNIALKQARGNYVAFLDADDIWVAEKLEMQLQVIEEKGVDLVFSDAYIFTNVINSTLPSVDSGRGFFAGRKGLCSFLELNRIPTFTVLAKKEVLLAVNGFTEREEIPQAEDYHLWLKLLMNGYSFFGSGEKLGAYRLHAASSSSADKLAVSYVIEALEDLKTIYEPYRSLLHNYQKKWFRNYQYSISAKTRMNYASVLNKNCRYLNRTFLIPLFRAIYFLAGINVTRRTINKLLNNFTPYNELT